ncbi:MAG: biotin synthase BioB [Actinomycetota bacterium]
MAVRVDNLGWLLARAEETVMAGGAIGFDDALALTEVPDDSVGELTRLADRVRRRFAREKVDLCSITSARSGICAEDCRFCTQSSHYRTSAPIYPMKPASEIVVAAGKAEDDGAHRFCIVTSGDSLSDRDFETVLEAVGGIRDETGLKRCASVGWLTPERAAALKDAGLDRYHHNIETARSFFPKVCSTHTYDDKLATINHLKEAGIETCVGGILNLGETPRQRIEFMFELKALEPDSVPVNFLIPRAGTPLGDRRPMAALEAVKYLAILRLVLPRAYIRLAGGRLETFGDKPVMPFSAGVNALLIGNLLTTGGPDARSDITLLKCLGFDVEADGE